MASAQQMKQEEKSNAEGKEDVKLPTETSPYVQFDTIEEYKAQGYGVQGHQTPVDRPHHGGGTDAPTLSGSGLSQTQTDAIDFINRHGVP
ncbi:Late embryogenesis abundant protein LEA-18 protein [Dioscorea alata]|uniref:Late embryogenesis abundant protein LEA-18 protein n=1 Tax=Dioscorea alata TaxID=55571 RepID=A0ACB7VGM4_DIOAL|nr:Late embryogenesis abundant protein LEA-18 protein [Dioscorea alata]